MNTQESSFELIFAHAANLLKTDKLRARSDKGNMNEKSF
jgi:hypothetical protein